MALDALVVARRGRVVADDHRRVCAGPAPASSAAPATGFPSHADGRDRLVTEPCPASRPPPVEGRCRLPEETPRPGRTRSWANPTGRRVQGGYCASTVLPGTRPWQPRAGRWPHPLPVRFPACGWRAAGGSAVGQDKPPGARARRGGISGSGRLRRGRRSGRGRPWLGGASSSACLS